MTIEELLSNACEYANLAVISSSQSNDTRALFAQIAHACAQTAQAMMMQELSQVDANGTPVRTLILERLDD